MYRYIIQCKGFIVKSFLFVGDPVENRTPHKMIWSHLRQPWNMRGHMYILPYTPASVNCFLAISTSSGSLKTNLSGKSRVCIVCLSNANLFATDCKFLLLTNTSSCAQYKRTSLTWIRAYSTSDPAALVL